MESLNIFESKTSLANFIKQLLFNPHNIASLLNNPPENEELSEFVSLFMRNRSVHQFLDQARHNPMMFIQLGEVINEEHPIICEIFDNKPPKMYDSERKISIDYVQFCMRNAIHENEYYEAHKQEIDNLHSQANVPLHAIIDLHRQCDGDIQQCLHVLVQNQKLKNNCC